VDLDSDGDQAALRAWVTFGELKLVIIDALVRAHGSGEDDDGLKPLLLWLDALGRETGCAFLVLHHERKGDVQNAREQDHLDAARGHSMLTSYPMLCLRVYRHGPVRAIAFAKVTRAPEPEPIYFRFGDGGIVEQCSAPERGSRDGGRANRMAVLAALQTAYDGRVSVRADALEATAGLSRSTVRAHLRALTESGNVIKNGEGRDTTYRPTVQPSEQEHLDERNGLRHR
jgi:DNA-binding transcriptional ArsR family regulator